MKIVKYFFVGGSAALVDISLFTLFAKVLGYNYLLVGFTSFIIATLVNYLLSIRFVFESGIRHSKRREVILVYIISGIGLLINLSVLFVTIGVLGFEMIFSKVLATGIVFFWNYLLRIWVVFE